METESDWEEVSDCFVCSRANTNIRRVSSDFRVLCRFSIIISRSRRPLSIP